MPSQLPVKVPRSSPLPRYHDVINTNITFINLILQSPMHSPELIMQIFLYMSLVINANLFIVRSFCLSFQFSATDWRAFKSEVEKVREGSPAPHTLVPQMLVNLYFAFTERIFIEFNISLLNLFLFHVSALDLMKHR